MVGLPIAPAKRLIKDAGAERVSGDAGRQLAMVLEDVGADIAEQAISLSRHAGRKTVTLADIQLACENIL